MESREARDWLAAELRRAAAQLENGDVSCPNCKRDWMAPATPWGGPMIPAKLERCPFCQWVDPKIAADFDAFVRNNNKRLAKKRRTSVRASLRRAAKTINFKG